MQVCQLSHQYLLPFFPFFPDSTSDGDTPQATPDDDELLSARFRGPKIATRKTLRTPKPHGKGAALEEEEVNADDDETEEEEDTWSGDE